MNRRRWVVWETMPPYTFIYIIRAAGLTAYTVLTIMKYNKNYSGKTAQEWLSEGKWTAFLMRVPLNKTRGYLCNSANDIYSIKVIASILSNKPDCDRKFSLTPDWNTKILTVTATKK